MKSQKNSNLLFILVFVIILLSVLGYYYSKTQTKDTNNMVVENPSTEISAATTNNVTFSGNLFYAKKVDGNTEIYSIDSTKKEKLVYDDANDDIKIKYIAGINNSKQVLVFMGTPNDTYIGSLYLLKNEEKTKIDIQFASSQAPLIAPDGSKIAYIVFSNVEFDYGFSLYTMSQDGSNKLKIATSSTAIPSFSFNKNSTKIAYVASSELYIYDLSSGVSEKIVTFSDDYPISKIYWNTDNNILATTNNQKDQKTIIYNVNINKKNSSEIYTSDYLLEDNAIWANDNQQDIFIIKKDNSITYRSKNDTEISLTQGNSLISWQP